MDIVYIMHLVFFLMVTLYAPSLEKYFVSITCRNYVDSMETEKKVMLLWRFCGKIKNGDSLEI